MRPTSEARLDTIAALATPPGRSAVAVVRISGAATRALLARLCPGLVSPAPRRATLGAIEDDAGVIDRGLVTFFPAPDSYTGEDVAEISVHGSPVVVSRLLEAILALGARVARPGEFTERAFLAGKMDLAQAEAVRDLIESRTDAAARFAARQLDGNLSRRLSEIRQDLLEAAAGLAATIDFAEDAGESIPAGVPRCLERARDALSELLETWASGRLLAAGCRIVILGSPNAGKSTLFNALAGSDRAIVTEIPGTTRDALEACVDIGGVPVTLVDTAGLRATDDPVESIGVARARQEAARADLLLHVLDAGVGLTPQDAAQIEESRRLPILRVANKIDLAGPGGGPHGVDLELCGLAADAGDRLRALLAREIASRLEPESSSELSGSLRQRDLLRRCRAGAAGALESLAIGESPEYAASRVHDALDALADFLGETTSEDVLQKIFATFCIGK